MKTRKELRNETVGSVNYFTDNEFLCYEPTNYFLFKELADLVIRQETGNNIDGYKEMRYIEEETAWEIYKKIVNRYLKIMHKLGKIGYGYECMTRAEEEEYTQFLKDANFPAVRNASLF